MLDVRLAGEWRQATWTAPCTSHSPTCRAGSANVPGGEVWVHCQSGYRAAIAASRARRARAARWSCVDDDFDAAAKAGLTVTEPERENV